MKLSKIIDRFRIDHPDKFRLADIDPADTCGIDVDKAEAKAIIAENIVQLARRQEMLYAHNRWAVLAIFQAMDAAGKDSAIKHVMSGVNPQGCQVCAFKAPSEEELDHDFLWRTNIHLPQRGRIGIFNRSLGGGGRHGRDPPVSAPAGVSPGHDNNRHSLQRAFDCPKVIECDADRHPSFNRPRLCPGLAPNRLESKRAKVMTTLSMLRVCSKSDFPAENSIRRAHSHESGDGASYGRPMPTRIIWPLPQASGERRSSAGRAPGRPL